MTNLTQKSQTRVAGGTLTFYQHPSSSCNCDMSFSIFLPPGLEKGKAPVLYWLSGLTCSEENFMVKAGAQRYAAELGLILVAPDTSPRGLNLAQEEDSWDFGTGAGFYVNATQSPWSDHYRMYDYVVNELPALIEANFPASDRRSLSGHSMGGHGALSIAQRNQGRYASVSAFSPICNPSVSAWGIKAFSGYLGEDRQSWMKYDSCVILDGLDKALPMLVDQGEQDGFLAEQLLPQNLADVCRRRGHGLDLRLQPGYDHSYYFIASFIGEHLAWHAKYLF